MPANHDETLAALIARGLTADAAQRAIDEQRIPLALAEQRLAEEPVHAFDDLVAQVGIDEQDVAGLLVALGLAGDRRFGETVLEDLRILAAVASEVSMEAAVALAQSRQLAAYRLSITDLNALRDFFVAPARAEGVDEIELADRLAVATEALLPMSVRLLEHAYRRAALRVLSLDVAAQAARHGRPEVDLAVGFADLAGYTRLALRVDSAELSRTVAAFEQRVHASVDVTTDVVIAKFLGDGVMLVGVEPATLADALLDLVEPAPQLEAAPVRAGMAAGPVVVREGDYFGAPVNTAARLAGEAEPWTLLADEHLAETLTERYTVKQIPRTRLRGMGKRRPVVVRRG